MDIYGAYHANTSANICTLRVGADGSKRLSLSAHVDQGIRTVLAAVLLRELDINPGHLVIVSSDTSATPQHLTAGCWGTASSAPVVEKAAR